MRSRSRSGSGRQGLWTRTRPPGPRVDLAGVDAADRRYAAWAVYAAERRNAAAGADAAERSRRRSRLGRRPPGTSGPPGPPGPVAARASGRQGRVDMDAAARRCLLYAGAAGAERRCAAAAAAEPPAHAPQTERGGHWGSAPSSGFEWEPRDYSYEFVLHSSIFDVYMYPKVGASLKEAPLDTYPTF